MRSASSSNVRTTRRSTTAASGVDETPTVAAFSRLNWRPAFGSFGCFDGDGWQSFVAHARPYRCRERPTALGEGAL